MIAKIQDVDYNSWWLYDNLEKVHYSALSHHIIAVSDGFAIDYISSGSNERDAQEILDAVSENNIETYGQYRICPEVSIIDFNNIKKGWNHLNFILSRDRDDNEKLIVFNTMGFILNNQGKTIERIPSISDMIPK